MTLLSSQIERAARGHRLQVRADAWPIGIRPAAGAALYAKVAPVLLPAAFHSVQPISGAGPHQQYLLRDHEEVGAVTLCGGTWRWHAFDRSAESRGLITLWSWRWDIDINLAHAEVLALASALDRREATH